MTKTKQPLTIHSDKTWEEVKGIKFMPVYRMGELTGKNFEKGLNAAVKFFEWSNDRPAEHVWEVMHWVESEDILFHANGDMIGGDE